MYIYISCVRFSLLSAAVKKLDKLELNSKDSFQYLPSVNFLKQSVNCLYFFFFFSSTTLYEFWLAQLFFSIVSSLAPSVSSSSLPSFSTVCTTWSNVQILLILLGQFIYFISIFTVNNCCFSKTFTGCHCNIVALCFQWVVTAFFSSAAMWINIVSEHRAQWAILRPCITSMYGTHKPNHWPDVFSDCHTIQTVKRNASVSFRGEHADKWAYPAFCGVISWEFNILLLRQWFSKPVKVLGLLTMGN
jgi:hypothetical protein